MTPEIGHWAGHVTGHGAIVPLGQYIIVVGPSLVDHIIYYLQ